tara:strand:+ start:1218 stop:1400 length:183 start_codon:yes stop_codon:yes gene_type:complete
MKNSQYRKNQFGHGASHSPIEKPNIKEDIPMRNEIQHQFGKATQDLCQNLEIDRGMQSWR